MSAAATELRQEISDLLTEAEIRSAPYVAETITPPCAVVVPGQPYIVRPTRGSDLPFGSQLVRVDVLLVAGRESAKKVAERIDQLIEDALEALKERDVISVSRPGLVQLDSGPTTSKATAATRFVAAVITIEEVTDQEVEA